jgi:hypothetical protein
VKTFFSYGNGPCLVARRLDRQRLYRGVWLAEAQIDLAVSGRIQLKWLNSHDYGDYIVARGTDTALEPPRLMEYNTDIHGRLRWDLEPEAGGCRLTFTLAASHAPLHYRPWRIGEGLTKTDSEAIHHQRREKGSSIWTGCEFGLLHRRTSRPAGRR